MKKISLLLVVVIGLGCAGMAVAASATPKQAASTTWTQWKREVMAAVDSLTSNYNKVESDTSAGNKGASEVDLRITSNDAVVLASDANSPSGPLNDEVLATAKAWNGMAWDGYRYITTLQAPYLVLFKADIATAVRDENKMAALIKADA
jgi:hypothetical protein